MTKKVKPDECPVHAEVPGLTCDRQCVEAPDSKTGKCLGSCLESSVAPQTAGDAPGIATTGIATTIMTGGPPTTDANEGHSSDIPNALFPLGSTCCTPGVLKHVGPQSITAAILRHARGEWGLVGAVQAAANDKALTEGGRLFSAYEAENKLRFWVITEADRSVTTVLLPLEY